MIAQESKKNAKSRMGNMNNSNKKQRQTDEQVFKVHEGVPAAEV